MNIERYTPDHYPEIIQWATEWKLATPNLPPNGFICTGVACGFVYLTDANVAMIEHYYSNKNVDKEIVSKALDEITENLLLLAKGAGKDTVIAYSSNLKIIERAMKFNFYKSQYNYIMVSRGL